ncbi:MAG: UvrD-helicase domain-containing protein [Gemmatimonadetes bacterium]|nr:UvrD-helicase domain-containing protein [Gemmatimonadota bacterium]
MESLARILVATFTEKATQELVTRIRKTLREAERVWRASPPPRTSRNDDLSVLRERHGRRRQRHRRRGDAVAR